SDSHLYDTRLADSDVQYRRLASDRNHFRFGTGASGNAAASGGNVERSGRVDRWRDIRPAAEDSGRRAGRVILTASDRCRAVYSNAAESESSRSRISND